jgi:tetratricopeptide (TPR) repeat protein
MNNTLLFNILWLTFSINTPIYANNTFNVKLDSLKSKNAYLEATTLVNKEINYQIQHNNIIEAITLFNDLAIIYSNSGNPSKAIDIYNFALKKIKKNSIHCPQQKTRLLINKAIDLNIISKFNLSLKTLDQAIYTTQDCVDCQDLKISALINKAALYINLNLLDSARYTLESIDTSKNKTPRLISYYMHWKSRLLYAQNKNQKAIISINEAINYDSLSNNKKQRVTNKLLKANILLTEGKPEKSKIIYTEIINDNPYVLSKITQYSLYSGLYEIQLLQKDSINAFKTFIVLQQIKDSIEIEQSASEFNKQQFKKELALVELVQKNKEIILRQEQRRTISKRNYLVVIFLLITTFLSYLLYQVRKNYNLKIQFKKQEITAYATEISSKNKAIQQAVNSLEQKTKATSETQTNINEIKNILNNLKFELNNTDIWHEFETSFKSSHTEFHKHLIAKHPSLSINEIRLCAFIKLNMTSKEISSINKKTVNSINVTKHRLKSKLDLPITQTVYSYIQSI